MAQKLDMPKEVEDQLNYWDEQNRKIRISQEGAINIILVLFGVLVSLSRCL